MIDVRKEPKLTLWEAHTKAIPADASSWSWNTLAPFHSGGPASEWKIRSDFQISCWRDPKAPLLIKRRLFPQLPEVDFPNANCDWRISIKATRGLLKLVGGDTKNFTEGGYHQTISYEYKRDEKRAEEGDADFRFIWQITQGETKKFALVIFHVGQDIPPDEPKATFEIKALVAFNLNGNQSFGSVTDKLKSYAWVTQLESDDPQRNVMAEMIDGSK